MKIPFLQRARAALTMLAGGYEGAMDSRFRTQYAFQRSKIGDEDNIVGSYSRSRLRLECRDMYRNHPVVRGACERISSYAVASGISPQARTDSESWNKISEDWWNQIYVPSVDFRQQQGVTLVTFQKTNIRERLLIGEIGYIMLENGQLQPVEAERIATPNDRKKDTRITEGIQRSASGVVVGYWVCPRTKGGSVDTTSGKFIPRENFIHCWEQTRPDMVHGIPDLAPVINKLRDYSATDENVLAKVRADAMNLFKRKTQTGGSINNRMRDAYKLYESTSQNYQQVEKMEGLQVHNMLINEDIETIEGKTPTPQYVPYMEHQLRIIAQALNIPYEFMLMIFTSGSFSAMRAAMIAAHSTIMDWVLWENRVFNQRLWNWRIAKAMKEGILPQAPVDSTTGASQWYKVDWSLPPWQEIDPKAQADGELAQYKMGQTSLKSIIRSKGRDRDDVFREKAEDQAAAYLIAKEVSRQKGVEINPDKIIETGSGSARAVPPGNVEETPPEESEETEA